jgi:hypothetical protein
MSRTRVQRHPLAKDGGVSGVCMIDEGGIELCIEVEGEEMRFRNAVSFFIRSPKKKWSQEEFKAPHPEL